ncbi:uncharacterized protein LOC133844704 [Drosophila sulfurigaster albostrigata]|uniref:uncharacterized protein LOC133844704 n=1 Tax=Drosophila sulfurigaster albostrigata TaxID=89887 RepID=UPI002D219A71|nr:uncharacterized protein LOC133844704 [Drosophila sulfurigaster albostrigata]
MSMAVALGVCSKRNSSAARCLAAACQPVPPPLCRPRCCRLAKSPSSQAHSKDNCQLAKMSIIKRNLLLLLLIINLSIGCWARPKPAPKHQQLDAALNEVTSREFDWASDPQIPNNLLEQLSAMRSASVADHQHHPHHHQKKRRPSNYWKSVQQQQQRFRGRFFNVPPPPGGIPPGGGNYYSNEVLPLSTYEFYEPEPIYSTAYY